VRRSSSNEFGEAKKLIFILFSLGRANADGDDADTKKLRGALSSKKKKTELFDMT
jgi:hypothetical protein